MVAHIDEQAAYKVTTEAQKNRSHQVQADCPLRDVMRLHG